MARVLVFCPDSQKPHGGTRILYRHVDLLCDAGFDALGVHRQKGFCYQWFKNETPTRSLGEITVGSDDIIVVPEICGGLLSRLFRGNRRVIFNQNCYHTFLDGFDDGLAVTKAYRDPSVIGILVVSEDSRKYLAASLPGVPVRRIHLGAEGNLFFPLGKLARTIAFMPRRNSEDILQVISMLKSRDCLRGYQIIPIDNISHEEVAMRLSTSRIFMSFGRAEGFPLPPFEALLSGCLVVGYHGRGGREYLLPDFSFPIEVGDVVGFARAVERALDLWEDSPNLVAEMTTRARAFLLDRYAPERERADIVEFWSTVLP